MPRQGDKPTEPVKDHVNGLDSSEQGNSKPGLTRRFKNQFKSSFPEAAQDIKIIGGMTALKSKVKSELQDSTLYPEVDKVSEVRRGLDLCSEEKSFLEKRK